MFIVSEVRVKMCEISGTASRKRRRKRKTNLPWLCTRKGHGHNTNQGDDHHRAKGHAQEGRSAAHSDGRDGLPAVEAPVEKPYTRRRLWVPAFRERSGHDDEPRGSLVSIMFASCNSLAIFSLSFFEN